jgi:hypothetical protein
MRNPMDEIREDIRRLHLAHARGDLRDKAFQRLLTQRTMDLYRALVQRALAPGEKILEEHHVVQAHMRLTQSVLKEPEQVATSLFLTQSRLLRVRSCIRPGQPATADQRDSTVLDELPLARIRLIQTRRRIRPGEICAGLAMAAVALIFWQWLEVTGVVLLGLGLLGAIHGLLLPTRWVEIRTGPPSASEPILVHAHRKKSGRALLRSLRERIQAGPPHLSPA